MTFSSSVVACLQAMTTGAGAFDDASFKCSTAAGAEVELRDEVMSACMKRPPVVDPAMQRCTPLFNPPGLLVFPMDHPDPSDQAREPFPVFFPPDYLLTYGTYR